MIYANNLCKDYKIEVKEKGVINKIKSFVYPQYIVKEAVKNISFNIKEGEIVGYLGPNGAGKSTTIKMMSGILHPTSGEVNIGGVIPYKNPRKFSNNIGTVFGHRSQLWWDLPALDSLELFKDIYKVPDSVYKSNINLFKELLGIEAFLNIPVRQLSLGQRMRVEIAAALIHNPQILFLDEPTLGLDILVKDKVRNFIKELKNIHKTTIILTTHDMQDIETVCERMIIIDHGEKVFDGFASALQELYSEDTNIVVTMKRNESFIINSPGIHVLAEEGNTVSLRIHKSIPTPDALKTIMNSNDIQDIKITGSDLEELIKRVYQNNQGNEMNEYVS